MPTHDFDFLPLLASYIMQKQAKASSQLLLLSQVRSGAVFDGQDSNLGRFAQRLALPCIVAGSDRKGAAPVWASAQPNMRSLYIKPAARNTTPGQPGSHSRSSAC